MHNTCAGRIISYDYYLMEVQICKLNYLYDFSVQILLDKVCVTLQRSTIYCMVHPRS